MSAGEPCRCASAGCRRVMPAARLAHPSLKGLCSRCWADERTARPAAPIYETEAWERGVKL